MKERQQAAQNQAQRPAQSNNPDIRPLGQPAPQRQPNRPPVRKIERATFVDEEVVEAELVDDPSNPRSGGPNRLSNLDTRPAPGSSEVHMADERMTDRLHETFDHRLGQLGTKQAVPLATSKPAVSAAKEQTNKKIEVQTQEEVTHWLVTMLQNPDTVRAMFLATEIFQRRF
jgi:hypothetical protein